MAPLQHHPSKSKLQRHSARWGPSVYLLSPSLELRINSAEETGEHFHGLGLCTFKARTILLECDTDLEMCLHKQIAQWIFIPRALPVQTSGLCALGHGVRLSDVRDGTQQLPRGRVGHKSDRPLVLVLLEDDGFAEEKNYQREMPA